MARKGRPSQGRRKIEIKKIQNEEARQVCFSKRRIGVFTKASELSTMCGAPVAVLVYSPSGTPYTFGSPSVDSVFDSFMTQSPAGAAGAAVNVTQQEIANSFNEQYMQITDQIAAEKERKAMLEERVKEASKAREFEWLLNMDQLGLNELNQLAVCLYQTMSSLSAKFSFLLSGAGRATANVGVIQGIPTTLPNMGIVHRGMVKWVPPPPPPPPSGAIVGPVNYVPNPFMSGSL